MLSSLFAYVRRHKWLYLGVALGLLIYDLAMLVPGQIIRSLVDQLVAQTLTSQGLLLQFASLSAVAITLYLSGSLWHYYLFLQSRFYRQDLQKKTFKQIIGMRTLYHEKFRSGDMMTRFTTDMENLRTLIGYGVMVFFYAGGVIAFILPAMFVMSWKVSLAGLVPILIGLVLVYRLSDRGSQVYEEGREAIADLSNRVIEEVDGIRVVRAYSQTQQNQTIFEVDTKNLETRNNRMARINSTWHLLFFLPTALSSLVIVGVGALEMAAGQLTLGQVLAIQVYIYSLIEPFNMLGEIVVVYQSGKISFDKLTELLETSDDLEPDGAETAGTFQDLGLAAYSFSYPEAPAPSLDQISLTLKAGQTLGIVGKTGSGKTTLVRQLLRQYPLGQGGFTLNGQPIQDYQRQSVEGLLAYVPQEHVLFSRTVRENIALGNPQASEEDIRWAVDMAAFTSDLERMPEGLDTLIGEKGVSISGGQKQRISLARPFSSRLIS